MKHSLDHYLWVLTRTSMLGFFLLQDLESQQWNMNFRISEEKAKLGNCIFYVGPMTSWESQSLLQRLTLQSYNLQHAGKTSVTLSEREG